MGLTEDTKDTNFVVRLLERTPLRKHATLLTRLSTTMIMRVVRIIVSFTFNVIIARMLGADGVGVYFLSYTITQMSTIISTLGLKQTLTRFTAIHSSNGDWAQVKGAATRGLTMAGVLSVVMTALVFLSSETIANIFSIPTLMEPLRWMSLSILPWTMVFLVSQMLQGINQIENSLFVQTISIPLINIPILILLSTGYGVVGAAVSYTISTLITLVLGYRLWRRLTPDLSDVVGDFNTRELLESSIPLFWYEVTVLIVGMLDVLVIGYFETEASVGIYNTVKRVSNLASAVLGSINVVVGPQFASMYAKGKLPEMELLARNSVRIVSLISIPVIIAFFVIPDVILSVFGSDFVAGANALRVLGFGQFINAMTGSVGILMIMSGNEKLMRNIAIVTSVLYMVTLMILTYFYGYIGSAWATSISSILRNIITMIFVYRLLDIMTLPFPEFLIRRWFRTNTSEE